MRFIISTESENDEIGNLICLTIHEHYEVHFWQGDWSACSFMMKRLQISPEERSQMHSIAQRQRVENGTHNFSSGTLQHQLVEAGTHHLLGGEIQKRSGKKRWVDGTHVLIGMNEIRIQEGTHNLLGESNPSYDSTIYEFVHIESGLNISMTQLEFKRIYHIDDCYVSNLISGKLLSTHGWKLKTSREKKNIDTKVYCFENIETKERVYMTQRQFNKTYSASVSSLISGRAKSCMGWVLISML